MPVWILVLCLSSIVHVPPQEPVAPTDIPAVLLRSPAALPRASADRWIGFEERERPVAPSIDERLRGAEELYRTGVYVRALEELFAILEAEPDYPRAWLVAGTTYFRLRRYSDTVAAYERLLRVAPQWVGRTQALAHARYSLGEYETAREHYEAVLAAVPDSLEARRGLALAYMRLGEDERALEL